MTLIDTSAWIDWLRPQGRPEVRQRVTAVLARGEGTLCPMVRVELWNGARSDHEQRVLADLEQTLPELDFSAAVWELAAELARRARRNGLTCPAPDLVIAACARHHGVELEHADAHFSTLLKL
jgi:predicted nucleic acid-binding protein